MDSQPLDSQPDPSGNVHRTADLTRATIAASARVGQFAVIEPGATVGERSVVEPLAVVRRDARIGNSVTVGSGAHVSTGVTVCDHVTLGANCCLQSEPTAEAATVVREGARVGAGVVVMSGVEIGQNATVEDGSVVAGDVPPGSTVFGNPAIMQNHSRPSGQTLRLHRPAESRIPGVEFIRLREIEDVRGTLTVCQWNQQLPFEPRRIFFLHGVPNENVRGAHAHKECAQALVCFNGTVNVLVDDGRERDEFVLSASDSGIVIPPGIWATQYRYSQNAMLVVFASHDYDADDYIRDYGEFLDYRRQSIDSAA